MPCDCFFFQHIACLASRTFYADHRAPYSVCGHKVSKSPFLRGTDSIWRSALHSTALTEDSGLRLQETGHPVCMSNVVWLIESASCSSRLLTVLGTSSQSQLFQTSEAGIRDEPTGAVKAEGRIQDQGGWIEGLR